MHTMDRIAAALAAPKTHAVLITYESGRVRKFESRCAASAESYADLHRPKIGRELIDADTDNTVRITAVDVMPIQ